MPIIFDPDKPPPTLSTDPEEVKKAIKKQYPKSTPPTEPRPPEKTVYTQQEFSTEKYKKVIETSGEHSKLISEEMQRRKTTDPYRDMPSTIETIVRVGEIEQAKQAHLRAVKEWHWAKNIPRGATIYRTPTEYHVEYDPRLEFAEREVKKGEKLPPVVKELYMFGLGVTHTGASFIKPFAQAFQTRPTVFTTKQPIVFPEKVLIKPTHFISGTDVIFEPLGLAPKGNTKLIGRTGPAGWIGMLVGETTVLYGYSKVSKPIVTGVKSFVGETYVKAYPKLPTVYKKFRWFMKRGIEKYRFRHGYKISELTSPYLTGASWKELPYNIPIGKTYPFRKSKVLFTRTGEVIPLETYTPVRPSMDGRIIDVGVVRYGKPKISTTPSKWFTAPRDSYWIKITQPPKFVSKFPETVIKGPTMDYGSLKVITKEVGVTRGFIPSAIPSVTKTGGFRMPGGWAIATGGVSLGFLEWLEEGTTYIHPRWGRKTISKTSSLLVGTKGLQFEKSIIDTRVKQDVFSEQAWKQDISRLTDLSQDIISTVIPREKQKQKQRQELALIQVTAPYTVTTPKPTYTPHPTLKTVKTKIRKPFVLLEGEFDKKLKKEPPRQGFNVFVKDRVYEKGKKRYSERFVKMNTKPMAKHDAMSFGAELVDQSAAASFRIKPTTGTPHSPPIPVRPWVGLQHMFYIKSSKKAKAKTPTYIEKTDYRINTPGEIAQISAKGWLANQMKPIRVMEHRKLKPRKREYKMFKMEEIIPISNIEKITKKFKKIGF